MSTSEAALKIIKEFEGCRLKVYPDIAGRLTIGWGTTQAALLGFADASTYPTIQAGATWSQAQADRALEEALESILKGIQKTLGSSIALNSNQMAALCSFVYNLGLGNFARSGLLRKIRAGDVPAAADQFLLWNRVGSYISPGLTRRREAEKKLFLSPPTSNPQ